MAIFGQVMPLSIDSPELAPQWAQFRGAYGRYSGLFVTELDGCHDGPMSWMSGFFSFLPSFSSSFFLPCIIFILFQSHHIRTYIRTYIRIVFCQYILSPN